MSTSFSHSRPAPRHRQLLVERLESRTLLAVLPTLIQFADADVVVREGVAAVAVKVERTGPLDSVSTVNFTTTNDTAVSGRDYSHRAGTISFARNVASATISIPITNDSVYEPSQSFNVLLSSAVGAQLGSPNPVQVIIDDDDIYDNHFSRDGRETIATAGAVEDRADALAVQSDGKILTLGTQSSDSAQPAPLNLTRFFPNGTLDSRFGAGGKVSLAQPAGDPSAEVAYDVVVLPNGKILATANVAASLAVARFNVDGSLDDNFGDNGVASLTSNSLARVHGGAFVVQPDGKIVMVGIGDDGATSRLVLARFLADGTPVQDLIVTTVLADASSNAPVDLALTANGLYVVAASHLGKGIVARFRSPGDLNTTFAENGVKVIDFGSSRTDMLTSVVVDSKGRILVGGTTAAGAEPAEFALARLLPVGGVYDATFAGDGQLTGSFDASGGSSRLHDVQLDANHRIVIVGDSTGDDSPQRFVVQRRSNGGALDRRFNATGTLHVHFNQLQDASGAALAITADRIVAAGTSDGRLAVTKLLAEHSTRPLAVVEHSSTIHTVNESNGSLQVTISRTGDTSVWAAVRWKVVSGTAVVGQDLPMQSGVVTFAAGETVKKVTIAITDDLRDEPNQTFHVLLNHARGFTEIGAKQETEITISDDDLPPALSISDASLTEGDSGTREMRFVVTPSVVSEFSVGVRFSTFIGSATAADFEKRSGGLVFQPGQATAIIRVKIKGDLLIEDTETFRLQLSLPTNATIQDGLAIGTIFDNDTLASAAADSVFADF